MFDLHMIILILIIDIDMQVISRQLYVSKKNVKDNLIVN